MLDNPHGDLLVELSLNMQGLKLTKPMKSFSVLTHVPFKSPYSTCEPRYVAVLVKNTELQSQMEVKGEWRGLGQSSSRWSGGLECAIIGRVRIEGQNRVFQLYKTEGYPSVRTHPNSGVYCWGLFTLHALCLSKFVSICSAISMLGRRDSTIG